jgi:hypothetical protein
MRDIMRDIVLAIPDGASGDQLRSLRDWLGQESELRGHVGFPEGDAVPGTLGSGIPEAITAEVGSGGAISALVIPAQGGSHEVGGTRAALNATDAT